MNNSAKVPLHVGVAMGTYGRPSGVGDGIILGGQEDLAHNGSAMENAIYFWENYEEGNARAKWRIGSRTPRNMSINATIYHLNKLEYDAKVSLLIPGDNTVW